MNKTVSFLALAGALAVIAVLVGRAPGASVTEPNPDGSGGTPGPIVATGPSTNGSLKLEGRLSHPFVTPGQSDLYVTVDITGAEVPGAERIPVNLAVVIDRSGSMSGEKLEHAKAAALRLVQQLRAGDSLAVVHYGSDVRVLPSAKATGDAKERMSAFIREISDDGGTNIGAGLTAARDEVNRAREGYLVNRVILISDGQPTEGVTEPLALTNLVKGIRRDGVSVSSIGVGTDFNEDLMQAFAEYGAGSYGYLKDATMLAELFTRDLQQAGTQVARNVTLSFDLPEGVELKDVLGYRVRTEGRRIELALTDIAAGQLERVVAHLKVTAPGAGQSFDVSGLSLAYDDLLSKTAAHERMQLSARVTAKEEEVLARRDKEATMFAARARTAQNTEKAARSFAEGKREEALQYLQQNEGLLEDAKQVAGEAAVADDLASQRQMQAGVAAAAAPEEVQDVVKAAKSKARKDFGRMSSTY
jgi:Ca-activated chloride channel family protein